MRLALLGVPENGFQPPSKVVEVISRMASCGAMPLLPTPAGRHPTGGWVPVSTGTTSGGAPYRLPHLFPTGDVSQDVGRSGILGPGARIARVPSTVLDSRVQDPGAYVMTPPIDLHGEDRRRFWRRQPSSSIARPTWEAIRAGAFSTSAAKPATSRRGGANGTRFAQVPERVVAPGAGGRRQAQSERAAGVSPGGVRRIGRRQRGPGLRDGHGRLRLATSTYETARHRHHRPQHRVRRPGRPWRPFIDTGREGFRLALDISAYSLLPAGAIARFGAPLMAPDGGSILAMTFQASERIFPGCCRYNVMGLGRRRPRPWRTRSNISPSTWDGTTYASTPSPRALWTRCRRALSAGTAT